MTCLWGNDSRIRSPTGPEPVNETTGSLGSAVSSGARLSGNGQHRDHPGREICLGEELSDQEPGQRSLGGRLQDDGCPHGDCRGHLVSREVEREVERRDAEDGTAREPPDQGEPPGPGRLPVESCQLSAEPGALLGCQPEDRDGAADFDAGPVPMGLPVSAPMV